MTKRFYVEIRDSDNKVHKVVSGYVTRADAENIARRYRENIATRGWNMSVYVGEQHQVTEATQ